MPTGVWKRTEEFKKRMSEICKKSSNSGHFKKVQTPFNKGKKLSKKHRENVIKNHASFQKERNPRWNGGIWVCNGYIMILKPEHPFCTGRGYVKRSRLVMEAHIGRLLTSDERIHHINLNKQDDRIKNLKLFQNESEHQKFHRSLESQARTRTRSAS